MNLGTHMPDGERRKSIDIVGQRSRSQLLKIEQKFDTFFVSHDIFRTKCRILMKLGTHMPDGERRKPIDIEVCR